jgi:hypothetical protein
MGGTIGRGGIESGGMAGRMLEKEQQKENENENENEKAHPHVHQLEHVDADEDADTSTSAREKKKKCENNHNKHQDETNAGDGIDASTESARGHVPGFDSLAKRSSSPRGDEGGPGGREGGAGTNGGGWVPDFDFLDLPEPPPPLRSVGGMSRSGGERGVWGLAGGVESGDAGRVGEGGEGVQNAGGGGVGDAQPSYALAFSASVTRDTKREGEKEERGGREGGVVTLSGGSLVTAGRVVFRSEDGRVLPKDALGRHPPWLARGQQVAYCLFKSMCLVCP